MNENLNLLEILKDCPKGAKLYSPVFGECTFENVNEIKNKKKREKKMEEERLKKEDEKKTEKEKSEYERLKKIYG